MPGNLEEAIALKARHPESVPMAGATDLLVFWPERLERHEGTYLDLSGVGALGPLRWTDDALEIGAMTSYWDVLQDARVGRDLPMLHQAARQVGAIQIQTRGTWAGNIANGSPAADGVPVLMAADAEVVLGSSGGERLVPLSGFYHGYKALELRPEEIIVRIRLPQRRYDFQRFEKVGMRRAQAITKVGMALAHSTAGWRVVANSMAPTVRRCPALEALLDAGTTIHRPEDLLEAAARDLAPIDDIRSTAEYRRRVFTRVLYHALRDVCRWPS
jgi:CO/xanthine dehydrogenase FAD-binding subunit